MEQHILEATDPKVLGRRLQSARRARGLTQQEVAESLAVARTTVTALEKGDRRIRPHELIELAGIYGKNISDFVSLREPMPDFAVQFRASVANAGSTQNQVELEQAVQEFQGLCEDYRYLEQLNGARRWQTYPSEYPIDGISPEDAGDTVALSERNRLGLGDGPILNLREALENEVGVRVFYAALPSRVAGLFSYSEDLGGCIAVNMGHPEQRRRWSIAHEYGHFLTNRFRSELTILSGFARVPAFERFADSFARSLLMPATGLRRRFYEITQGSEGGVTAAEVCRVAHYYFVSVEAMMLRLEELRLLPSGTWERLRDRGFRVREAQEQLALTPHPHDDQSLSLRYQYLAVRAYQEGNLTEGELARFLRVDRVQARRTVQALSQTLQVLDAGEVTSISVDLGINLYRHKE